MSETLQTTVAGEDFRVNRETEPSQSHDAYWDMIADAYEAQWKRPEQLIAAGEPEPLLEAVNPPEATDAKDATGLELAAAVARAKGLHAKALHIEEAGSPDLAIAAASAEVLSVYGADKGSYERTHGIAGTADVYHQTEADEPADEVQAEQSETLKQENLNELTASTLELAAALIDAKSGQSNEDASTGQIFKLVELYNRCKAAGGNEKVLRSVESLLERAAANDEPSSKSEAAPVDVNERPEPTIVVSDRVQKAAEKPAPSFDVGQTFLGPIPKRSGTFWRVVERHAEDGSEPAYKVESVNDASENFWLDESALAKYAGPTIGERMSDAAEPVVDAAHKVAEVAHEGFATVVDVADEALQNTRKRIDAIRESGKRLFSPDAWKNGLWKDVVLDGWAGGSARVSTALAKWREADDFKIYEKVGYDQDKFNTYKARRSKFMLGGAALGLLIPELISVAGVLDSVTQHAAAVAPTTGHGLEGFGPSSTPPGGNDTLNHTVGEVAGQHAAGSAESIAQAHDIMINHNEGGYQIINRVNEAMGLKLRPEDWLEVASKLSNTYAMDKQGAITNYGFDHSGLMSAHDKLAFVRYAQENGRM